MDTPKCKQCGAEFVRLSRHWGLIERVLGRFDTYPFRCQMCGHHFFVRQPGKIYSPEEDKREYVRVRVQCSLTFTGKNIQGYGQLIDLSLRGCGMETSEVLLRGKVVQLTLRMPDGRNPLDIEAAVVRYVQGSRVGVEFLRIADKAEAELRDFVQERLRQQNR